MKTDSKINPELMQHISAEEIVESMFSLLDTYRKIEKNADDNSISYIRGGIEALKQALQNVEMRAGWNKELSDLLNK